MSEVHKDTEIHIDAIMQEIRAEIKEKHLDSSMLSFEEIPFDAETRPDTVTSFQLSALQQSADYLHARSQITPYKPIAGNFLIVCIKKIIRKLAKFYILPIVTEQNALNLHTANAVNQIQQYITEQQELLDKVETLERRQAASQQEITALHNQIKALTAENEMRKGQKS